MLEHLHVATVLGAALGTALRFTIMSICVYDRSGHILYANDAFWKEFDAESKQRDARLVIGPELWETWEAELKIVLSAGQRLRYVAEFGRNGAGHWLTSRCSGWKEDTVKRAGMLYVEVLPASKRRGVVVRLRIPLTEILHIVPGDAQLHHDTTLSQRLS